MSRHVFWGGLLLLIGVVMLLETLGIVSGSIWKYLWPLAIIVVGIAIIFREPKQG